MGLGQKQCPTRWKNRVSCELPLGHAAAHTNLDTGFTWLGQTICDPVPGSLAAQAAAGSYEPNANAAVKARTISAKRKNRKVLGNVFLQLVWLVWWGVPFIILWGLWQANVLIFVVWLVGTVYVQSVWENRRY